MFSAMILRKTNLSFPSSAILCFALVFLHICLPQTFETANLVYCPLQKTWVLPNLPKPLAEIQSLHNLCASEKLKNLANFRFSLKTFQPLDENLFFDYLKKGESFFTAQKGLPDLPKRNSIRHLKSEFAVNNFTKNLKKSTHAYFSFEQHQRPPNNSVSVDFAPRILRNLEKISRNINPRSPPIFV